MAVTWLFRIFRYCTVNSLVLNLWRQWRRRRWRRTKMASSERRIRVDRTELGADGMWGERVWGEPALGRNVWHPGIIFEELSPADLKSRPWKTPVPKGKAKGEFYKQTTLLVYRQWIQRNLHTYCPTIVIDFIESDRFFKGTRNTRISTFTFHIVYMCAVCLFQTYIRCILVSFSYRFGVQYTPVCV